MYVDTRNAMVLIGSWMSERGRDRGRDVDGKKEWG